MKKFLLILTVSIALVSCSAQNRFNRLITNHPDLLQSTDTTFFLDTTIRQGFVIDTIFIGKNDTFYLQKNRVTTRIIKNVDTLFVNQTELPDTIITERLIIEKLLKYTKRKFKDVALPIAASLFLLAVMILFVAWRLSSNSKK